MESIIKRVFFLPLCCIIWKPVEKLKIAGIVLGWRSLFKLLFLFLFLMSDIVIDISSEGKLDYPSFSEKRRPASATLVFIERGLPKSVPELSNQKTDRSPTDKSIKHNEGKESKKGIYSVVLSLIDPKKLIAGYFLSHIPMGGEANILVNQGNIYNIYFIYSFWKQFRFDKTTAAEWCYEWF